jgi:hypothetical protein
MSVKLSHFYWNKNLHWFLWPVIAVWKYKNLTQFYFFFLKIDFRIVITTKPNKRSELPITKKFGLMDI